MIDCYLIFLQPVQIDQIKKGLECDKAATIWLTAQFIGVLNEDLNARHEGMQDAVDLVQDKKHDWLHRYTEVNTWVKLCNNN